MLNHFKLKAKMLITICSVVFITFSLTIAFMTVRSGDIARRNALDRASDMAHRYSGVIKSRIDKAMDSTRIVAHSIEGMKKSSHAPEPELLDMVMREILEKNGDFSGIWVMLDPGTFYNGYYSPWFYRKDGVIVSDPVEGLDKYEEAMANEYYTLAKNSKKEILLEPYKDTEINILMTTASVPVIDSGRCIGVVGIDIMLDDINDIIKEIHPFGTGTVSVISNTGKYVAHNDRSKLGKDIEDAKVWEAALDAINSGKLFAIIGHSESLKLEVQTIFVPMQTGNSGKPWAVAVNIPMDKVVEDANNITILFAIIGIISILITAVAITLFSGTIIRPINGAIESIKKVTQGDLTIRLKVQSRDEIGDLSIKFNEFIDNLQSIIKQISQNAVMMDDGSDQLLDISTNIYDDIGKTSGMVYNISSSADEMRSSMSRVSSTMEESSSSLSTVASMAEEMAATISEITKSTEKAKDVSDKAVLGSRVAGENMAALSSAAEKIGKVVETITEISAQTNLLALNATIEAARAGAAGKGFSVVAGEIKALASQTAEATLTIKRQIEEVQSTTTLSVKEIDQISGVINGVNAIIASIATAVAEQSTATHTIAESIDRAAAGIESVNIAMNSNSSTTAGISRDIVKVESAASSMATRSNTLKVHAEGLKRMAADLKMTVGKFEV